MVSTSKKALRKKILSTRGVAELAKRTRKPISHDELPTPYNKTPTMKWMELKHHKPIEELIAIGTIYECGKRLHLHPTTIYKWRLMIEAAKNEQFWKQFKEGGE